MATFECNFNSYCRGRPVTITVIIPTADWSEMGFTDEMRNNLRSLPADNCRDSVDFIPLWRRFNSCDHTPRAKYPVLYLLCAGDDDRKGWEYKTQVIMFCEERKIALVMVDPEGAEWHMDRDYEFMTKEVPEFVCGMFPVSRRPEDTYIAGTSRGAGGALHYALREPEAYGAIGLFSSSLTMFEDAPVPTTEAFFAKGNKLPPVYMSIGTLDGGRYRFNSYAELLRKNNADVTYVEEDGYGHGYRICNIAIEKFLNWLPRTDYYAQFLKENPERGDGQAMRCTQ